MEKGCGHIDVLKTFPGDTEQEATMVTYERRVTRGGEGHRIRLTQYMEQTHNVA